MKCFETSNVELSILDKHKTVAYKINALTTNNVTSNLEVVDWNIRKSQYKHLKDVVFPEPNGKKIDILIGIDNIDLHRVIKEVYGKQGDPIARLTPLGWTCIGASTKDKYYSHFISSFHSTAGVADLIKVNDTNKCSTVVNIKQTSKTMDQNQSNFLIKDYKVEQNVFEDCRKNQTLINGHGEGDQKGSILLQHLKSRENDLSKEKRNVDDYPDESCVKDQTVFNLSEDPKKNQAIIAGYGDLTREEVIVAKVPDENCEIDQTVKNLSDENPKKNQTINNQTTE